MIGEQPMDMQMDEEPRLPLGDEEVDGWEWAFVEVMGHRSHAGRCREVERFGTKLIRVDVPIKGDPAAYGWKTHFYPGTALFSYTPTDETSVMRENKPYERAAVTRLPPPDNGQDDLDF